MRKVNLQVMRPWIASKVTELVGFEDEVVVEYAMGLLEDSSQPVCCFYVYICLLPSDLHLNSDTGPTKNANQPDRISNRQNSRIHACTLEPTSRSADISGRYPKDICGREKGGDASCPREGYPCIG